jgi:hypothetical protein
MVFRFVQSIEPVAHATVEVPGSIVGSGQATVEADRVYANVRTLWVEPETGVIIKGEERQNSALRFRDGATVTLTEATIGYDDRTVSENATEYGDLPTGIGWSGTRRRWPPLRSACRSWPAGW